MNNDRKDAEIEQLKRENEALREALRQTAEERGRLELEGKPNHD